MSTNRYRLDPNSALVQRNAANQVRFTASLVSGGAPVKEKQGPLWAAECKTRTIIWRLSNPFKPTELLTNDQIVWLTIHEAGHLEYTGSWDMPPADQIDDPKKFFRFWNGAEDIRIERLLKVRFPGTKAICHELHKEFDSMISGAVDPDNPQMSIADQVMVGFLNLAEDLPVWVTGEVKEFIDKHWPMMDYICDTSLSSAEVARRILPIYKELIDLSKSKGESGEKDGSGGSILVGGEAGEGEEPGSDGPSEPHVSQDKDGNPGKTLSLKEVLEGICEDATGDKGKLIGLVKAEENAQRQAEMQAAIGIGTDASGVHGTNNAWDQKKSLKRGSISRLSSRLQNVLDFNQSESWESHLKRGSFDSGHAHRSLRGDMRVFRKKTAIGRADYDFLITVDMSSSQSGRWEQLLESCVVASEAIERCGMGLAIITWDGKMRHFKSWHTPLQTAKGAIGYDLSHPAGGTIESYALRVGEEMCRYKLREGRQVFLITLTDGETSRLDDSRAILYDMEKAGVKTIGIGVMHSAPKHYTQQLSVQTADELANVLPNLLRDIVRRG